MTENACELSIILVNELYGDLASLLFQVLLRYGRLQAGKIAQRANLSLSEVQCGLVVLIQHNIVFHYTVEEGTPTFYEANQPHAYSLLRLGKYVNFLQQTFGDRAAEIGRHAVLHGQYHISHQSSAVHDTSSPGHGVPTANKPLSNGLKIAENNGQESFESDADILDQLRSQRYVQVIGPAHFRSYQDNYAEAEREILSQRQTNAMRLTGKEKDEIHKQTITLVNEWLQSAQGSAEIVSHSRVAKRAAPGLSPSPNSKRIKSSKTNSFVTTSHASDENIKSAPPGDQRVSRTEEAWYRLNFDKYTICARNTTLIKAVEQRIGPTTAKVYKHFLNLATRRLELCEEQPGGPTVFETAHVARGLSEQVSSVTLKSSISDIRIQRGRDKNSEIANAPSHKRLKSDPSTSTGESQQGSALINGFHGPDDGADFDRDENNYRIHNGSLHHVDDDDSDSDQVTPDENSLLAILGSHLRLLAEDSFSFVRLVATDSRTRYWMIDFPSTISKLRQHELELIAYQKFGDVALRVIRFLKKKGKMEEKQIQASLLLPQKHIRATLAQLHSAGFIELQEVPRESNRLINRNIYLWFFDTERCSRTVIEKTYRTMSWCFRQIRSERGNLKSLLEKAERSDVKGREQEYLTPMEQKMLKEWSSKEESYLARISRLDDVVATLRDF